MTQGERYTVADEWALQAQMPTVECCESCRRSRRGPAEAARYHAYQAVHLAQQAQRSARLAVGFAVMAVLYATALSIIVALAAL